MLCLQSGGSRKISAHEAARTHHSPAYDQLLHYVVPTARTAGFQRRERPTGSPRIEENKFCPNQKEKGVRNERRAGAVISVFSLLTSLPLAWKVAAGQKILQG